MTGPASDAEVAGWVDALGLPCLVDMHVHFMPENVLDKVWHYFDCLHCTVGVDWPIHYRMPESERLDTLRVLGVGTFAPLLYPHKPDMAQWLNDWAGEFAARVPDAVHTATFFPEPGAAGYVRQSLEDGVRCFKVHVQVGGFDPRDPLLDDVWGLLAEAGVPAVVHCGNGPMPGNFTGLDIFGAVLARHPQLVAVLAHAGLPDFDGAFDLLRRYPRAHLDTTMVGVEFADHFATMPPDWAARLADVADRVVFGTDFPNIPYEYAAQLRAVAGWAGADDRLGESFLHDVLYVTPRRLLNLDA